MKIKPEIYYLTKYFSIEIKNKEGTAKNLKTTLSLIEEKVPFLSKMQVEHGFLEHKGRILNTFNFYTDFFHILEPRKNHKRNIYRLKNYTRLYPFISHSFIMLYPLRSFQNNHMVGLNSILYSSMEDLELLHSFNLVKKVHLGFEHHKGYDYMLALITRNRFKEASFLFTNGYAELTKSQILTLFAVSIQVNINIPYIDIWHKFSCDSFGHFKDYIIDIVNNFSYSEISDTIEHPVYADYFSNPISVFYNIHSWDDNNYQNQTYEERKKNLFSFFLIGQSHFQKYKLADIIQVDPERINNLNRL